MWQDQSKIKALMPLKTLFSTHIYSAQLSKKLNKDLLDEVYKLQEIDSDGKSWSAKNYVGGYTSYGSMDNLHKFSSTFADLEKIIDKHVRTYIKSLKFEFTARPQIWMNSCWANVMPAMAHHSSHIHPLSFISGTYYLKVPKQASSIKFEDPRLVAFMGSPQRSSHFEIQPREGQIVLFESWLRHEVPAHTGKQERISISFNYSWE